VGPATYEFLHKTFGEFLTADFLLAQVLAEAKNVAELAKNPALGDVLGERLDRLNEKWFGCLVHTPLHTQPNVLLMLREWAAHRPAAGMPAQSELIAALDRIVVAQLRGLLETTTLPTLAPLDRDTPYAPLPALEHLAIYTLNLVLLRAYLCDDSYVLNESSLEDQAAGVRPWDRLTALWRSWFAPESLAALASRMTATRTMSGIVIVPAQSPLAMTETTALATAYNVSLALADDLTTASLGLHLASLSSVPNTFIEALRERVRPEVPALIPVIDLAVARTTRHPLKELPTPLGGRIAFDEVPGYLPLGLYVEYAEMADRLFRSPASRATLKVRAGNSDMFVWLSRYAAEVAIDSGVAADPWWLSGLLRNLRIEPWRTLLSGPAAAPVLRAARRQLAGGSESTRVAREIGKALDGQADRLFDVDTAAGVAVIAWRGGETALCSLVLDRIIRAVEQGVWRLLDIPTELWGDLADLFVSAAPEAVRHRSAFAGLLSEEIRHLESLDAIQGIEVRIAALRIGASGGDATIDDLAEEVDHYWAGDGDWRLFLLLVRCARENSDHGAVKYLFSREDGAYFTWKWVLGVPREQTLENVDVEAISMSLSYREAMDLRWALDIARQELPDQGAGPRPSSSPRRPPKR
jgi:hypothetical protein